MEDVGKCVAWLGDGEVAIHDDTYAFRHEMNPKFVSSFLGTAKFNREKIQYVVKGKIKRLQIKGISKICIPCPPLAEQARIVAILDNFDTLTNSISEGLPREIELRQKQYAHYRDLLLGFPKPSTKGATRYQHSPEQRAGLCWYHYGLSDHRILRHSGLSDRRILL